MKRTNSKSSVLSIATAAAAATLFTAQLSYAVPVTGVYLEDPRCDVIPQQTLSHELGDGGFFPINESIQVSASPATFTVCVPNDGIQNDWIVMMTNTSGIAWRNLFFVADLGLTVGNADGSVFDAVNAPGVVTDAFRIDGTVTIGLNNNLLGESGPVDEIFQPGETWRFNVSNFVDPAGTAPMPLFRIPAKFAGSEPFVAPPFSTASILAIPVPEPTTIAALALPAIALLMRRRRRV